VTGNHYTVFACIAVRGAEDGNQYLVNNLTFSVNDAGIMDGVGSNSVTV
jgi:hypothetical protein